MAHGTPLQIEGLAVGVIRKGDKGSMSDKIPSAAMYNIFVIGEKLFGKRLLIPSMVRGGHRMTHLAATLQK
jgi:hypothetical protein